METNNLLFILQGARSAQQGAESAVQYDRDPACDDGESILYHPHVKKGPTRMLASTVLSLVTVF